MKTYTTAEATRETFPRLRAEVRANAEREAKEAANYIANGYRTTWAEEYRHDEDRGLCAYCTPATWAKYKDGEITRAQAVERATRRALKGIEKQTANTLAKLDAAASAPALIYASILVEWSKTYNPTATIRANNMTTTGSAYGWGYDKHSTAIAEALNANPSVLRVLYELAEKALTEGKHPTSQTTCTGYDWRNAITYGAGYDVLPYFEGGVGFSCFETIFNMAGYIVRMVATSKRCDCYTVQLRGQTMKKQYKPTSALRREMWNAAGYRERYAMQEGNANTYTENGYTFIKFTYGTKREYQDANGATYCVERHAWIY